MAEHEGATVDELLARAHALVPVGRYREAIEAFGAAMAAVVEAEGQRSPRLAEIVEDLATVRQMAGVADFGEEMGFRHWKDPIPPEAEG